MALGTPEMGSGDCRVTAWSQGEEGGEGSRTWPGGGDARFRTPTLATCGSQLSPPHRGQGRAPGLVWGEGQVGEGRARGVCAPRTAWWARPGGDGARTRRRRGAHWGRRWGIRGWGGACGRVAEWA